MKNTLGNNIEYIEIHFNENNEPSFMMGESIKFENEGDTEIVNLRLNITRFGKADRVIIATTLSTNQTKYRWILIKDQWYKVSTPTFWISLNSQWEAKLYDSYDNPVTPITDELDDKEHEEVVSIDHLSLLEAFGSHHHLVKIKGKWRHMRG